MQGKNFCAKSNNGFTLIETIVYLALFAVLIGGFFTAAYNIAESQNNLRDQVFSSETAIFVLAKISWALLGEASIAEPASGGASARFSVSNNNFPAGENPLKFFLDGSTIMFSRGAQDPVALTGARAVVSGLSFVRSVDFDREFIVAEFTVDGQNYKRKFYLNN